MVLGFLLGGIASAVAGAAISSYSANRLAQQQQGYNSALNKESYKYAYQLNEQMATLNKGLTSYNYDLERDSRQTSFADTRKSLEEAGYNPLLALGTQSQGMNPSMTMSGSGFQSADSDAVFNAMNSATSAYNNTRQIDQLVRQTDSNIDSSKAQNIVNYNLAELYHSQERGQDINNRIESVYGAQREAEILNNLKKDGVLKDWQVKQVKQDIAESVTRSSNISAQTALSKQQYDINEPTRRFAVKHPVAHGTMQRINPASAVGSLAGMKYLFGKGRR